MDLINLDTKFKTYPAKISYVQKVKMIPVEHHYENEGEKPYIKYGCQICEKLAENSNNKLIKFSFVKGTEKCPCCGINIDWSYSQ